jgi:hypothetical protein
MTDNTNCTIDHLKERNKVFFSKGSVKFHRDIKYEIIREGNKSYLKVTFIRAGKRGFAYYEFGKDLKLNYTNLMENVL